MIIKTFTAESAAAALKKVRADLGKDAVVLKTRELAFTRGGDRIEITACADKAEAQSASTVPIVKQTHSTGRQVTRATFPSVNAKQDTSATTPANAQVSVATNADLLSQTYERVTSLEKKLTLLLESGSFGSANEDIQGIREQLTASDLPVSFVNELITSVANTKHDDLASTIRTRLTDTLISMMLPSISFKPGDRVAFLGYAGAGKTSTLGKLAARLVYHEKQKITLVTLDTVKVGAFEELSSYADILGSNASDFQTASNQPNHSVITLIDTPALPRQAETLQHLRAQVETLSPNYRFAVISAMTRSVDAEKIAAQLSIFKPTHVVFTMTDLTDRWGSVVAACRTAEVPVVFATGAPAGMGTVTTPDPAIFTRTLLATEETRG